MWYSLKLGRGLCALPLFFPRLRTHFIRQHMAGKQSLKTNNTAKNESLFFALLISQGLPLPEKEVKMIDGRRYRIDYAWPDLRLGVEIQGGVYTRGAHGSITGILQGYKKSNDAALYGWTLLYFTPAEMKSLTTINHIKKVYQWKTTNGLTQS